MRSATDLQHAVASFLSDFGGCGMLMSWSTSGGTLFILLNLPHNPIAVAPDLEGINNFLRFSAEVLFLFASAA
ncbi:MAG: hypothetical protein R2773_05000 [Flavobacteriaceae bacterium]